MILFILIIYGLFTFREFISLAFRYRKYKLGDFLFKAIHFFAYYQLVKILIYGT